MHVAVIFLRTQSSNYPTKDRMIWLVSLNWFDVQARFRSTQNEVERVRGTVKDFLIRTEQVAFVLAMFTILITRRTTAAAWLSFMYLQIKKFWHLILLPRNLDCFFYSDKFHRRNPEWHMSYCTYLFIGSRDAEMGIFIFSCNFFSVFY